MAPRKYTMDKRKAAVEETRQRILEATLALHAEKGIFGTSWQDIAKRADVSVGTVYKHFPSLDELVPACGELMYAITRPPSLEDAPQIFAGASSLEERLGRLVEELFAFYERGAPYIETDFQERRLPAVRGVGGIHAGHHRGTRARGPCFCRTRRAHGAVGERAPRLFYLQVLRGSGRPEGASREGHQRGHPVLDRVLAA